MFYFLTAKLLRLDHMYKVKLEKVYKIKDNYDTTLYIYLLSTHGEYLMISIRHKKDERRDTISMYYKTYVEHNIKESKTNEFELETEFNEVKECDKQIYLEVYQNDTNAFISNIFTFLGGIHIPHIKEEEFNKISNETAKNNFKNSIQKILNSNDSFASTTNLKKAKSDELKESLTRYPKNINLLYKIITRCPSTTNKEEDNICIIFIFTFRTELFYVKHYYTLNKDKVIDYDFPINNYEINCCNKIEKIKDDFKDFLFSHIDDFNLKDIKVYQTKSRIHYIEEDEGEIVFDKIRLKKGSFNTVLLDTNDKIFKEVTIEDLLKELKELCLIF